MLESRRKYKEKERREHPQSEMLFRKIPILRNVAALPKRLPFGLLWKGAVTLKT